MKRAAFSLVELSIVLVILGLLTGGILAGQSLIRAAELRAVSAEYSRYSTAFSVFRDKYFAVPGDFHDATRFWGRMNSNADCVTNSSAAVNSAGTCDGNGDNWTPFTSATAGVSNENFQIWRQLALAGLIEGSYAGTPGSGGAGDYAGTLPKSKLSPGYWWVNSTSDAVATTGDTWALGYIYGNYITLGGLATGSWPNAAILKPEEAWNIDTKMDDGKPGTGKLIARYWNNACMINAATSTDNVNATYNLSNSTKQCMIYFTQAF